MTKSLFLRTIVILVLLLFANIPANAALKKVLVLDFINIEKKADYDYLEASITDAVKEMLKKQFAFRETSRSKWEEIADMNFIYKDDYYTKTAAMNLGLLAKQDIVISGGYRILTETQTTGKGKRRKKETVATIVTNVRILDISKKKTIAEFVEKGPADNRIWDSVAKIAERITEEAKAVLPSKEEWQRTGAEDDVELIIVENLAFGIRAGGAMYSSGFADRIEVKQPIAALLFRGNLPIIWEKVFFELDAAYHRSQPIEGENPDIEQLNIETENYLLGGYFGVDFKVFGIGLHPKIGGGYVIQQTEVTGYRNEQLDNSFPYAGGGLDISYDVNNYLSVVLGIMNYTEFEEGEITLLNAAVLGVNFRI